MNIVSEIDIRVVRAIDMLGADRVFTIEQSERVWGAEFPDGPVDFPPEKLIKRAAKSNKLNGREFFLVALQGLSVEEMWKLDQARQPRYSRYFFSSEIKGRFTDMLYLTEELKSEWAGFKYSPRYQLVDFLSYSFDLNANMVIEAAITVAKSDRSTPRRPLGMREHPTSDVDSKGRKIWVGNQSPQGLVVGPMNKF